MLRLNIIYLYEFIFLKKPLKKIAIIGPESTGKSTLSKWLTEKLDADLVPEMARNYLSEKGLDYTVEDIYNIAKIQYAKEVDLASKTKTKYLICDTDLICILVWLDFYSYPIEKGLIEKIKNNTYDLFLLMDIDIEWEEDTLRANPQDRSYLFQRFIYFLEKYKKKYAIISGHGDSRYENALQAIMNL